MGVRVNIYAGKGIKIEGNMDRRKVLSKVFDSSSISYYGGQDFSDMDDDRLDEAWLDFWLDEKQREEYQNVSLIVSGMTGVEYLMQDCVEVFDVDNFSGKNVTVLDGEADTLKELLNSVGYPADIKNMVVVTYN